MLKTVSAITNAIGALNYKGIWNASTNSPALASGVGTKGDYYVVSVAGSTSLDGISNWGVGDWAAFNGTAWQRVEGGADLNGVNLSVSGTTTLSSLTASTALALDANKNVVSVTNTGTGNNVLSTSPTLTTPAIGDATATSVNKVAITAPATSATLTIANGKTLTANNSLTLSGTDATTMTFPTTNATMARTDAGQTFTGDQRVNGLLSLNTGASGLQTSRSMSFLTTGGCTQYVSHSTSDGSGDSYAEYGYNGTKIGSITQNGTTGVLYNVMSDYRLKNVIGPVIGAGERIDALQPVEYEWKSDGSRTRGFLAHQFQEVYLNSVTGKKDAVDEDGKPVYQNMQASTSEVIADLVAEIKELRRRVAELESK
jgi:hypothetical protein